MASTDPGVAFRLRPLSVGDLIDEALKLFRADARLYLLLMLIPFLPIGILTIVMAIVFGDMARWIESGGSGNNPFTNPATATGFGSLALLGGLFWFVGYALASGGVTYAVSQRYLGRRVTVEEAFTVVRGRLVALMVAPLLVGLLFGVGFAVVFGLAIALGVGASLGAGSGDAAAAGAIALVCGGMLVIIPLAVWVGVRLALMSVAIVLENLGPWEGIRRSWSLIGGHWWRSFLILFVVSILVGILAAIPQAIGGVVAGVVGYATVAGTAIRAIFQFAGQVLVAPISLIAIVLLYYDLRVRKEGFDLEMMAQQLRGDAPMPPAPGMSPPSAAPW